MAVNREKIKEKLREVVFRKPFYSQSSRGPDYELFVSSSLPLFGETLGGMRYGTGGDAFPNGGDYPSSASAATEDASLDKGMTRKYTIDLIPRRYLEEQGLITHDESKKADFLGAKMVVRDKNKKRAEEICEKKDSYSSESQHLFEAAGAFVNNIAAFNPSDPSDAPIKRFYNTAPDSNTSSLKMTYTARRTDKVHCLPEQAPYYGSGDPSVVTATGLIGAWKRLRELHFPGEDRLTIGIKGGAGSVGSNAIRLVREYEASGFLGFSVDLKASDVEKNAKRLIALQKEYGFEICEQGTEHRDVHIWSPNALIGSIIVDVVKELRKYTVIAGAENEQLPENPYNSKDQRILDKLYAIYSELKKKEGYNSPDVVNNNGGIHDVNCRIMFGDKVYSKQRAIDTMLIGGQYSVGAVYERVQQIQQSDRRRAVQSHVIAEEMGLEELTDRLIERKDEVLAGPFRVYFEDVI